MAIRVGCIGIDTNDLATASGFWRAVTGYQVSSSGADHVFLADPAKAGPGLFVQLVPEPRAGKNRLHIDLFSDDLEGEAARLRALGATVVQRHPGDDGGWIVLADPDGNQFCIVAA
jgi:predicted enzyme related to lactoylglutathione lyase